MREAHGDDVLLGAGTIRTPEHAREAADAGAEFLVSPGLDDEVIGAMLGTGATTMGGALTPTEVMRAVKLGVDVVKVFPASLGGPAYVKSLRGPFPDVPFMPTGGVNADNVADWFAAGVIAVGAGGELCSAADIAGGRFDEIERRAREFGDVKTMEFVGVTTGSSSIMKLFPLWARELGIDAELVGPRPPARRPAGDVPRDRRARPRRRRHARRAGHHAQARAARRARATCSTSSTRTPSGSARCRASPSATAG